MIGYFLIVIFLDLISLILLPFTVIGGALNATFVTTLQGVYGATKAVYYIFPALRLVMSFMFIGIGVELSYLVYQFCLRIAKLIRGSG